MLEPLDFSCLTLIEGHCHVFSMFPAAFCPPAAWWPAGGVDRWGTGFHVQARIMGDTH